jgi:probable F420-dependent oxidoreductase
MRIGLALPQYDYSVPGESPLRFSTIAEHAKRADDLGYDSLWLSDHLFLDLGKYSGSTERHGAFEPIATLGALAAVAPRARLGTLVLCEALRAPTVAAKALATLDRVTGGRLDIGLGAGWYEPEYEAIGMAMPSPGVRVRRLREATELIIECLEGGEVTHHGEFFNAEKACIDPPPLQSPRPPVFIGGKGDRVLATVAAVADGWNTCWVWSNRDYSDRVTVLERACAELDRDPASVSRSLGLYALVGESERDLEARFERLRSVSPRGVLETSLDEWRIGRLVGTVEQVREQAEGWRALGVETLIVSPAAVPFQVGSLDDVEALIAALAPLQASAPGSGDAGGTLKFPEPEG